MPKDETPESILSERNYLWNMCEKLYNAITLNGSMKAASFRMAIGAAGSIFKGKMDMGFASPWFESIAEFLESFEKAKDTKVGPE